MENKIIISANTSWYIYNFRKSLILSLQNLNYKIYTLAPVDEYTEKLIKLGCNHEEIKINNMSVNPFTEIFVIVKYYKVFKKIKPCAILNFTPKPNIYGSIAARLCKIPCINNITGLGTAFIDNNLLSKIVEMLYKVSQKNVYRIFFQNKDDMSLFVNLGIVKNEQIDLLPGSGVDLDKFLPLPQKQYNTINFILIARLIWDKGIGEFIEAAKIVKQKYPFSNFFLLGDIDINNPKAVPEEKIKYWEKQGLLKWYGKTDDVRPFIANCDCVVLPSYREGVPKSLLEAASMGKPIITTNVTGCKEVVDDNITGFLCEVRNPIDLANKMEKIILMSSEERMEMGKKGREKMIMGFNEKIVINKYIDSLKNLLIEVSNKHT